MEFFSQLDASVDAERLQAQLGIADLPRWCASIHAVREDTGTRGEIETVWGVFEVSREPIRGGIRFNLLDCPNAFTWSVTTDLPPRPEAVVVHASINRREHDPDFVESIETFVVDWCEGLEQSFA